MQDPRMSLLYPLQKKKGTDKHVHVCEYETQEVHCAPVEKQVLALVVR